MDGRLVEIHARMVQLDRDFFALPENQRADGIHDKPIRDESRTLCQEAEALMPIPELPDGFRFGFPAYNEDVEYLGVRILPDEASPPELWGMVVPYSSQGNSVLSDYGLEMRPNSFGDFFLIRIGSNNMQDVCRRDMLLGPANRADEIEHIMLKPKEAE